MRLDAIRLGFGHGAEADARPPLSLSWRRLLCPDRVHSLLRDAIVLRLGIEEIATPARTADPALKHADYIRTNQAQGVKDSP